MNSTKTLKILIAVLIVALVTSLGFLGQAHWRNYSWKEEADRLASMVGTQQAKEDFRQGKFRVHLLQGDIPNFRYSGTNDGPFEIWLAPYYTSLGYPHRYSAEQRVVWYNDMMRFMHENPDMIKATTNGTAQNKKL